MDPSYDVFLTCLPRDVNEVVIRNLFRTVGNVSKVKIIDDKKNDNYKLCFVGFGSMDEAMEAVRLGDKSTAFGEPIKASISKKSLDSYDSQKPSKPSNDFKKTNYSNSVIEATPARSLSNAGRGRGMPPKRDSSTPAFVTKSVNLTDIKLKSKELIDVEIVDLSNLEFICARPLKHTEKSKVEIIELLVKLNASTEILASVEDPVIGDCYLGKWDDGAFYRAELLEVLSDGKFKVTFVDEGTSGDIVSEIKSIPEGPLQQYPKQFTRISLGCKNSEDLRNFIMNESEGKKVKLYWLGDFSNGAPLINLFLGDEEIVEKFIQLNKNYIRDSFSLKFKDLPNHKPETDCSRATLIQSLYRSQSDFTVQIKEPAVVPCQKKTPLILPVPGDICVFERRTGVNNVSYWRCVIRRRLMFAFDILLVDSGENLNNVSIDSLYAAEDVHKISTPFTIICENDKSLGYSEETFLKIMSDENRKFSIVSYRGNNRYLVAVACVNKEVSHYPDIVLSKFVGQNNKVLVTHVVTPINFYVQVDKAEYVQILSNIHSKLNSDYNGARFNNPDLITIKQAVVAPFSVDGGDGENFRAIVLEKRRASPDMHVYYIDYGNDGWVDCKQLLDVDADIVGRPGLAINCTLNIDMKKDATKNAIELFSKLVGFTDNDCEELSMQVIGHKNGQLIVDLTSPSASSICASMIKSCTCVVKEEEKGVTIKPLCNGDSKRVANCEISGADISNKIIDCAYLLKKINDLEQRVAYLEKKDLH